LWLCAGPFASNAQSSLHRLFGGVLPHADVQADLGAMLDLRAPRGDVDDEARLPPASPGDIPPPRVPERRLRRDWWIHSFSQLHRQRPHGAQALVDEAPADDERPLAMVDMAPPRFGGTRFGNALHHALEHVDFARWRDCDGSVAPDGQAGYLQAAMQAQDYAGGDVADGARELSELVARTLNASLPVGPDDAATRLCEIAAHDRVAELEFHFTLHDTDTHRLLELLHAHGVALSRRDFGAWPRLSGLMNGRIDLTCRIDGRVYVLDYKSNRLPDYDDATLRQAMAASEYDLQALLYVVAAHRWLRLRRGPAYDYERDIGGALYMFCRGLQPGDTRGIAPLAFPRTLVEGVDALCGGGAAS